MIHQNKVAIPDQIRSKGQAFYYLAHFLGQTFSYVGVILEGLSHLSDFWLLMSYDH